MENKMFVRDGEPIQRYEFGPAGSDNTLQKLITEFLHNRLCSSGVTTLAELGYFHMNMVSYVEDHVEVKIYFHPALATDKHVMRNGKEYRTPKKELALFQNYLFIGDVEDAITYDTIAVPKYYIDRDDLGKPALKIRNGSKKAKEDVNVLVLRCNLALTMAAIFNINLMDPYYQVEYETLGASSKKDKDKHIIITAGNKQEYPVRVMMERSVVSQVFDPELALPYIESRIRQSDETMKTKKKLQRKVSEKAEKLNKGQKTFTKKDVKTRW